MAYQFASVRRAASLEVVASQPSDPLIARLSSIFPLTPGAGGDVT